MAVDLALTRAHAMQHNSRLCSRALTRATPSMQRKTVSQFGCWGGISTCNYAQEVRTAVSRYFHVQLRSRSQYGCVAVFPRAITPKKSVRLCRGISTCKYAQQWLSLHFLPPQPGMISAIIRVFHRIHILHRVSFVLAAVARHLPRHVRPHKTLS